MSRPIWLTEEIEQLYELPFIDLIYKAQTEHRRFFNPNKIQFSSLLSIKTGTCPEDCAYCPQSAHYKTSITKQKVMDLDEVIKRAAQAKNAGATRFCLGAAWRSPNKNDLAKVLVMITEIKKLELETCATLGMLNQEQAEELKKAGLDFYNHNLDTSPDYYKKIISTRRYADRLTTLENVRQAQIKVCCGGIIGMGETRGDRIELLKQLANLPEQPESVPINHLIAINGTPLENCEPLESFEFIRTVAVAKILMPESYICLSAGRENMSDEMQTLCFIAGANSLFLGDTLLTTKNPLIEKDFLFFRKIGLEC